ncbi:hypothetical protein Pelo_6053 [Pelomyxa schiedti]|nr:hypothetical protein Pelo_6053 [Pelomyxa schiedti]
MDKMNVGGGIGVAPVALFFAAHVDRTNTKYMDMGASNIAHSSLGAVPVLFSSIVPSDIPLFDYLLRFTQHLYIPQQCCVFSCILALRAMENGLLITHNNVHRIILISILIASKFLLDEFQHHTKFALVGGVTVHELRALEVAFLRIISFNIWVEPDEFNKFRLQLYSFASSILPSPVVTPNPLPQHQLHQFTTEAQIGQMQHAIEQENSRLQLLLALAQQQTAYHSSQFQIRPNNSNQHQQQTTPQWQTVNITYNHGWEVPSYKITITAPVCTENQQCGYNASMRCSTDNAGVSVMWPQHHQIGFVPNPMHQSVKWSCG